MPTFVAVHNIEKVFPLTSDGKAVALEAIELDIRQGEFVSLIGNCGCGNSTLLSLIAGVELPSDGLVTLGGQSASPAGSNIAFQSYSLLPWLTVRENIAVAVDEVLKRLPWTERRHLVEEQLDLVELRAVADKLPGHLSRGMKQQVAIGRALAIRPKLLLLDNPFGILDAVTRSHLQEQLMRICEQRQVTAVMVTHNVDEAVLLSDRIVMLSHSPSTKVGGVLDVAIERPRRRIDVVNHPRYYRLRSEMIGFLSQQRHLKALQATPQLGTPRSLRERYSLSIASL